MDDERFTVAVAVNNRDILKRNLFLSPDLGEGHPHQIIIRENYPSASIAYNSAIDEAEHDVIIFVHQDVYFPDAWFSNLGSILKTLDKQRVRWGVLGSFGSSRWVHGGFGRVYTTGVGVHGNPVIRPERIETLDEIVLVIRKSSGLRFDASLSGFHLYGTDICLEADAQGLGNYAIPGFCVHNTNQLLRLPKEFRDCYYYIKRKWATRLPIYTSCITISRFDNDLASRSLREFCSRVMGKSRQPLRRVDDPRSVLIAASPK